MGDKGKRNDKESKDKENQKEDIRDYGNITLSGNEKNAEIELFSIIGEIEGHENLSSANKTTKYEHILPQLARIEDSKSVKGVLFLLNTYGGDVEAGLAIAEMIASLSKPSVSLVLGGSHSIGVPIAVSTSHSFIVPTGTMVIHPVRMNGTVIGARQTFEYFKQMQDRIVSFISNHCKAKEEDIVKMMMETEIMTKDLGTILVGEQAVKCGIIDEVGGIKEAMNYLHSLFDDKKNV